MRGDSIRDFYAKTLALFGLGVLAGTGALVDYWPSGVTMPSVGSGLTLPLAATALPVPSELPSMVEVAVSERRDRRPRRATASEAVVRADARPSHDLPVLVSASLMDAVPAPAVLWAPPPALPVPMKVFAAGADGQLVGEEVSLSPPAVWPGAPVAMSTSTVALSSSDEHGGLLSGAVKRTKTSLVWTGRKTGASMVGALRVVSGFFKKALPN